MILLIIEGTNEKKKGRVKNQYLLQENSVNRKRLFTNKREKKGMRQIHQRKEIKMKE